jgi:hypothetical protein
MGANAGIVAAESVAEMSVPIYVVGLDANAAQIQRSGNFATMERGGPAAMIGFEQQITIVRPSRQIHQLIRAVAR